VRGSRVPSAFLRRSLATALVVCVAVALAACSSAASPAPAASAAASSALAVASSAPAASTAGQPAASLAAASAGASDCVGAGVTFCGHIAISGGVTHEADFVSGAFRTSCADWLKGNTDDPTLLTLPMALTSDINVDAVIMGYKGPGTYDVQGLAGNLGGFQVAFAHDVFVGDGKTTGSAILAVDGSGSVTAKGMQPAGDANKVQLPVDLSMTWTCYTK
jgi:hypothetical protein